MKRFWQWMTRPKPRAAALTQAIFLACIIILSIERIDLRSERDTLRERVDECEAKIANLDSSLVMCHNLLMFSENETQECEEMLNWELVEPVRILSLYDSTVVIDGILYEHAAGARTAWNGGVGIPFKGE